ncbi:unnamed protein product [Pieris brassicae]|uniref:Uncharacterized protein n=1 Tax=Pieris brassicae TaxID=7116 RepID=A0A9P0TU72_PIEBR|nr:unnamed protein product [Pieris brassicae]
MSLSFIHYAIRLALKSTHARSPYVHLRLVAKRHCTVETGKRRAGTGKEGKILAGGRSEAERRLAEGNEACPGWRNVIEQ